MAQRLSVGVCRGGALPRPEYFSFFASGGLLLSVATKVNKSAIQGGRKFRSSFPLENPPSLSDQRGRAAALPLWKHPPGVGDYQIAPLPQSGKGRWRPLAAVDMKRGTDSHVASLLGMTGKKQGGRPVDGCRGGRVCPPECDAWDFGRRCVGGDAHIAPYAVASGGQGRSPLRGA